MAVRLFLCCFFLPCHLAAQQFIADHIVFWDSVDRDKTDILYYFPQQQAVTLAVRWYYDDRHDIREEFVRIDDGQWLFNSYDTTGAWRFRRGPMRIDAEHPQIDRSLHFDPDSYEEIVQIDTSWRLVADGFWQESDTAGFYWSGAYRNGLRQGPWSKVRVLRNEVYDLRNIVYTDGRPQPEIMLNLALAGDSAAVEQALLGAWVQCGSDHQLATWLKWDGRQPQNCGTHHGSTIYWFQADHVVQQCYPSGSSLAYKTETGRWSVDGSMALILIWDEKKDMNRFPIRSLLDKELRLDYRK